MHLSGVGVSGQQAMENAPWDPDQAAVLADLDPELHRLPPHTGEVVGWPGGNMTGMAGVGAELAGKSVQLICDMLPTAHRVVVLANAPDPFSKPFVEHIRLGGAATGTTIDPIIDP